MGDGATGEERALLSPYRVLDVTEEKGFLAGKILGDLGADVIKIERPGGDPSRAIGPFYHDIPDPEKSLFWFAYNTSKRGITLDLDTAEGHSIFARLVATSDVVIESFLPDAVERLGLSWQAIATFNPRTILTSIRDFGQSGSRRGFRINDIVAQAMGGLMYTCGDPGGICFLFSGAESRQSYLQAGAQAAVGTMIALEARERTGKGQHVEVSIEESMAWAGLAPLAIEHWEQQKEILERKGSEVMRGNVMLRSVYPCKDGYVTTEILVGARGHLFAQLVGWMAEEGMADDLGDVDWSAMDMFALDQERVNHWQDILKGFFMSFTRAELTEQAVRRGFMLFPVNEPKDLLTHPQAQSRRLFVEVEHPELQARLIYPGPPYKSTEGPPALGRRAPLIGEHNEEVYGQLGLDRGQLQMLARAGVI